MKLVNCTVIGVEKLDRCFGVSSGSSVVDLHGIGVFRMIIRISVWICGNNGVGICLVFIRDCCNVDITVGFGVGSVKIHIIGGPVLVLVGIWAGRNWGL